MRLSVFLVLLALGVSLIWVLASFVNLTRSVLTRSVVALPNGTFVLLKRDEIYLPEEGEVMKLSEECWVFKKSYSNADTIPELFKHICRAEE